MSGAPVASSRRARTPGSTKARTRARVSVGVGEVGRRVAVRHVGQDDAPGPLGRPRGLVGLEPAAEERRGQVADGQQNLVEAGEGQVRQDQPGLVGQQVAERLVRGEPAGRLDDAGDQHVLEVMGLAHDDGQRREQAGHLGLDHGAQDAVLAPREGPVDGGPGQPGLPGDVVDGALGHALAGQAAQGGVDDADPGRGAVVGAEVPDLPERPLVRASVVACAAPTGETVWRILSQCQPPLPLPTFTYFFLS